jgi:hypothetical protein
MDFKEVGWGGTDWIDLAQYRDHWRAVANMLMTSGFIKSLDILG